MGIFKNTVICGLVDSSGTLVLILLADELFRLRAQVG